MYLVGIKTKLKEQIITNRYSDKDFEDRPTSIQHGAHWYLSDDADVLIEQTAVEQSTDSSVAVFVEDVDLSDLLIVSTQDILILKSG